MSGPLLEMRGIGKSFPGVRALRGVDLALGAGEIVCLLGENGAGKSTLMKVLTGVYPAYEGSILLDGAEVRFRNPRDAFDRGISIVFQEFNLCPNLTAAENLFLGRELRAAPGWVDRARMRAQARETFRNLGAEIDPDAPVSELGVAQQQMIEVAKALAPSTRLLVMDEPTSALAGPEVENLFRLMRELRGRGITIVFISHKLDEVMAITDRVVCLKDGENAGEIATAQASEEKLVAMMVGRELDNLYGRRAGRAGEEVVLEARGLCGPPRIRDASFRLRRGEIVGLAGLVGAGRTELARLLMGSPRRTAGEILVEGRPADIRHPADAVGLGIAYASEDRKQLGLVLPMTVRENATMCVHGRVSNRLGMIRAADERELTDRYIRELQIKVSDREQVVRQLSGGNQQKVVLAKWLAIRPKVLILDEPTRGIDVGAKAEVHRIVGELADAGVAVLLISSELPEILHLCDRVLVMHEGRLTGDFPRDQATEETVMRAAVA